MQESPNVEKLNNLGSSALEKKKIMRAVTLLLNNVDIPHLTHDVFPLLYTTIKTSPYLIS